MVKRLFVSLVLASAVTAASPAFADPPPTNNNVSPATFSCTRGSEQLQFEAIGIGQSAQIAGQVSTNTNVIVFVRLVINGQVIFEVPGQIGRSDLWSCAVTSNPGTFVDAFITPR